MFFLSLLQVLFTAEREKLPFDPAWDFDFLSETEAADCACGASYRQMLRQWKREYVYEMMRLGLEVTPYRTLEHIAGVHHIALTCGRALRRSGTAGIWRWYPAAPPGTILESSAAIRGSGWRICTTTTRICGSAATG